MVIAFHFCQRENIKGIAFFGQTGVDLFFVLSGFLITTILLRSSQNDWHEVKTFYIRRTLRIFPLYYAVLLILTLVGSPPNIWYWTYLQNYSIAHGTVEGPIHLWSLAVEEQFYLVQPFLVLFLPRRLLPKAFWTIIGVTLVSRIVCVEWTSINMFYFGLSRLDGLAFGSLLAIWLSRDELRSRLRWLLLAGGGAAVGVLLLFVKFKGQHQLWVEAVRMSLITVFYTAVLGWSVVTTNRPALMILRSKLMRSIGRVSYAAYVFHPFIFDYIFDHFGPRPVLPRLLLCIGVTFALSYTSWYGFERHFIRLKDRFAPEKERFPPSAEAPSS